VISKKSKRKRATANMNTTIGSKPASNHNFTHTSNENRIITMMEPTYQRVGNSLALSSPSMRIIPCRARGVCDTHTPQSAYFTIPQDCKHGTSLWCSHTRCRESGRGFRYCKVCDQVTAKRNFNKRHCHHPQMGGSTCSAELSTTDSFSRSSKKRKLSVDAESSASSIVDDINGVSQELTRSNGNSSTNSGGVPSMVYTKVTVNNSSIPMIRMNVSCSEARLIQHVRSREGYQEETLRWIHEILECENNAATMMKDEIGRF
jgi:hypothetical protein